MSDGLTRSREAAKGHLRAAVDKPVVCWPWRLRATLTYDRPPVGEACCDCGTEVAVEPRLRWKPTICIYCAMDQGRVPVLDVPPEESDERTQLEQYLS